MAQSKIVLRIKNGGLEAEGMGFKGKACEDKMAFLNKVGQIIGKKDKLGTDPEPAPHVNIKTQ